MGTFAGYYGSKNIPKVKREEFTKRVLKILEQGGMMQFEAVNMFGRNIELIHLPVLGKDHTLWVNYNYFDDDVREDAFYNADKCEFITGKVGTFEFNWIVSAVNVLYEFYAEEFGMAQVDGRIFDATCYIGWLNYLFDEKYTNSRALDSDRIIKLLRQYGGDEECLPNVLRSAEETIQKVKTTDFLYISDYYMRFLGSKKEKNYHMSDDDRSYYWTRDNDVCFSEELKDWFEELKEEYNQILQSDTPILSGIESLEWFIRVLDSANNIYERIYPFKDMFYDFVHNCCKKEYQSAIHLFERLIERHKLEGAIIMNVRNCWEYTDRNITFNDGRLKIKRYLAVMANRELRESIFGF